ncbi:protein Wnt-8b-like [Anneissia japonica]|uniref:protein Wnt-8b-like n=1 Tax=Anneissia japonica TaxID=1529436 RepID=UPI0014257CA8|nr:protein Wnt-8b-like [Anneissia japonica]
MNFRRFFLLLLGFLSIDGTSGWMSNLLMTGPKALLSYYPSVAAGATNALLECQRQFKWDKWNCPESSIVKFARNELPRKLYFPFFFIMCIRDRCGCDDSYIGRQGGDEWTWGGCSDNVDFGDRIARQFVDALETGSDARAAMNLHNSEAGRRAVHQTMNKACKCHGVSGSCSIQTCWKQLAEFGSVGSLLKKKFENAVRADFVSGASSNEGNMAHPEFIGVSKKELVYLDTSPNYCLANTTAGITGTEGRECIRGKGNDDDLSKWEKKSCKRICSSCGLSVKKTKVIRKSSCNCSFQWCCNVKCDECVEEVTILTCSRKTT